MIVVLVAVVVVVVVVVLVVVCLLNHPNMHTRELPSTRNSSGGYVISLAINPYFSNCVTCDDKNGRKLRFYWSWSQHSNINSPVFTEQCP